VKLSKNHKKKGCISDSNYTKSRNKTHWISQKRSHEPEKWLIGDERRAASEEVYALASVVSNPFLSWSTSSRALRKSS